MIDLRARSFNARGQMKIQQICELNAPTEANISSDVRGQMKIQQMAFVLVAFVILLGLGALFAVSFGMSSFRDKASDIRDDQAREYARSLAGMPELRWTLDDCASCIDLDKALALSNQSSFAELWDDNVRFITLRRLEQDGEQTCTRGTYPSCTKLTLFDRKGEYHTESAFVALCRAEQGTIRCELGKIVMGVARA